MSKLATCARAQHCLYQGTLYNLRACTHAAGKGRRRAGPERCVLAGWRTRGIGGLWCRSVCTAREATRVSDSRIYQLFKGAGT
jgi:hypothetical protein